MSKYQTSNGNRQSAGQERGARTPAPDTKTGKNAASHTKAGHNKGAGGGAKQQRKH